MLQQRSPFKITFANKWSNTCCSHPQYNKVEMEMKDDLGIKKAVQKRLKYELGINVKNLDELKTVDKMVYQAMDQNEFGESELDYLVTYKVEEMPKFKVNLEEI